MEKLVFIFTILLLCVSGCVSHSNYQEARYDFTGIDKIAIVAINGQIVDENAKSQVADLFIMELRNKGYSPIPLSQSESKIQAILDIEPINVAEDAYAQMGQLLKVPAVLVINVPYLDDEISISAQILDSQDGSVLWMGQDYGSIVSARITKAQNNKPTQEDYLMDPLLMFQPRQPQPPQEEVPAMTVKAGDRPFNPQELERTQIIVANICSSLPAARIYKPTTAAPVIIQAAPEPKLRTQPKTTPRDW